MTQTLKELIEGEILDMSYIAESVKELLKENRFSHYRKGGKIDIREGKTGKSSGLVWVINNSLPSKALNKLRIKSNKAIYLYYSNTVTDSTDYDDPLTKALYERINHDYNLNEK